MEQWDEPEGWRKKKKTSWKAIANQKYASPRPPSTLEAQYFLFPTKHLNRSFIPYITHPLFFLPPKRHPKLQE